MAEARALVKALRASRVEQRDEGVDGGGGREAEEEAGRGRRISGESRGRRSPSGAVELQSTVSAACLARGYDGSCTAVGNGGGGVDTGGGGALRVLP